MIVSFWVPVVLGTAFLLISVALANLVVNIPDWLPYAGVALGVLLLAVGWYMARVQARDTASPPASLDPTRSYNRGGSALATGEDSVAEGGAGGLGPLGGRGGDAKATGKGARATGGRGGDS